MSPYADQRRAREWSRLRWRRNREAGIAHLGGKCVVCGSAEKLEIDHVDRHTKTSSSIWSWSLERRLAELAKCQLLCHHHHFEKTLSEFPRSILAEGERRQRIGRYEVFG